jgi:lactoylglutathione lyase
MKLLAAFAFLLGFVGPSLAYGQAKPITRATFNHAAVCVHDLKRSTAFYRTVLDLPELPNPFNDGIHTWFSIGPNLQLHVIQRDCTPVVNKNIHLCFSVESLGDFMRHLEQLNVAYTNLKGDSKEPTARIDGVKQIYLQDPDGYWIEINDAK